MKKALNADYEANVLEKIPSFYIAITKNIPISVAQMRKGYLAVHKLYQNP